MYNDNLARKYEMPKRGKEVAVSTPKELPKSKKKVKVNIGNALKLGLILVCFVAGSLLVLSKNVEVTEQNDKVSKLKEEYSVLETDNRKKEIEISRKVDIATVEEKAISSCNMNRARQDQILYVDVQTEDYGVVSQENKDVAADKKGFIRGLIAYLK